MSECPKVSVIIVTYNYAKFLPAAIESVLAQSFTDYELIVVDNGSNDNTPEVIERYAGKIKHCRLEKNAGRAGGKNVGIKMTRGKYIQFLDADDTLLPEKLEKQVRFLEENQEIGIVYSDSMFVNEYGEPMPEASRWYRNRHFKSEDSFLKKLVQENFLLTHDGLLRREAVLSSNGFDEQEDLMEDWDFWFRLALGGNQFYLLPEILSTYYKHGNSATNNAEYRHKLRKTFVYKHLADENLENFLGAELYQLFRSYQHWVMAVDLYNLKKWSECCKHIMESAKTDGYKISFEKISLLIKSQLHKLLRH